MKTTCIILTLLLSPTLIGCGAMGAAGAAARAASSAARSASGMTRSATRAVRSPSRATRKLRTADDGEAPAKRSSNHAGPGFDFVDVPIGGIDTDAHDDQRRKRQRGLPIKMRNDR